MNRFNSASRAYLIAGISLVIAVAAVAGLGAVLLSRGSNQAASPAVVSSTGADDSAAAAAAVAAAMGKISVAPRTVVLTSEKALRVRSAIKRGDYATATKISAEVLAASHLQAWDFQPFSRFIVAISDVTDPTFEAHLGAWVATSGKEAMPLLVRARYYRDLAWLLRGGNFSDNVAAEKMRDFDQIMRKALDDAEAALALDDGNPYGFYLQLNILHSYGVSRELVPAFLAAIAKFPSYYPLYTITLDTLQPKWGGRVEDMLAFVDHYAGQAQEGSPLKLLYLALYRDLLDQAAVDCYRQDQPEACVAASMAKAMPPDLQDKVNAALRLYDRNDKYQYGAAVEGLIDAMLQSTGGSFQAGAILQLAAESMQSDTQLTEDKPGHNDYMVDKMVARSWYRKGFYDNAAQKDQEALTDIDATAFPGEEEKDLAIAGVYYDLALNDDMRRLYPDLIAAEKTALALGGPNDQEHLICYSYYQLKAYDAAVQACDTAIADDPANLTAYYWRGRTYDDMGKKDAALQDLTAVAASEHGFRQSAAIEMSMIYFGRKDLHGALDLLNKYTYLYDPKLSNADDMAIAFNNRCYAYMELGDLKKALADCRDSLKHGSIPDAYRKEQDLIKRLGPQGSDM